MTEQEIILGNKRIMQFISHRIDVWEHDYFDYAALNSGFNTDWNKLLQAVTKINEQEYSTRLYDLSKLKEGLVEVNIDLVWVEVVKYVEQWRRK